MPNVGQVPACTTGHSNGCKTSQCPPRAASRHLHGIYMTDLASGHHGTCDTLPRRRSRGGNHQNHGNKWGARWRMNTYMVLYARPKDKGLSFSHCWTVVLESPRGLCFTINKDYLGLYCPGVFHHAALGVVSWPIFSAL